MTKNEKFPNGQNPEIGILGQNAFAADPCEELSVCCKNAESLSPFAEVEALWKNQKSVAAAHLLRLLEGVGLAMGRIPQAQGFFTSAADRKQTFLAICSFLELLKKETLLLDSESLGFGQICSMLRSREMEILRIEARVLELQKKLKRQTNCEAQEPAEELLKRLSREKEQDAALLGALRATEAALGDFLTHTCREFCRFAAAKADMEHDGAGASPAEISRLLWGLRQVTETLLKNF